MLKDHIYFPGETPLINERTVLYYENQEYPLFNSLFRQHYLSYKDYCQKHGFTLIYLPGTSELNQEALERLANQFRYLYPRYFNLNEKGIYQLVKMLFEHYPGPRIYTRLREVLGELNYPEAGFIIFDEALSMTGKPQHRTLDFAWMEEEARSMPDPEMYLQRRLLNFFINELSPVRVHRTNIRYMMEEAPALYEKPPVFSNKLAPEINEERRFEQESRRVAQEFREKFAAMMKPGQEAIIMGFLADFFENVRKENPKLAYLLEHELGVKPHKTSKELSPLHLMPVSGGYDFKILLPDYDLEILMTPLCKTLYLFFLRHPEGVMLKDLGDHRDELSRLYRRISNLTDTEQIQDNIDRLTDVVVDNSIHVNCTRIKKAFLEKMHDDNARHYYISGGRGRPKRIALNPRLIRIDAVLMDW
jgi:hypothetical protein